MPVFRSWDFDLAAFVLFDRSTYRVRHGVLLPSSIVQTAARSVDHVNGHRFVLKAAIMAHPELRDVTEALRSAAELRAGPGQSA